jgi:hypothetical protein
VLAIVQLRLEPFGAFGAVELSEAWQILWSFGVLVLLEMLLRLGIGVDLVEVASVSPRLRLALRSAYGRHGGGCVSNGEDGGDGVTRKADECLVSVPGCPPMFDCPRNNGRDVYGSSGRLRQIHGRDARAMSVCRPALGKFEGVCRSTGQAPRRYAEGAVTNHIPPHWLT